MKKNSNKILTFFKKNATYLVLTFCILAIGLSVTLMLVQRDNALKTPLINNSLDLGNGNLDQSGNVGTDVELPEDNQPVDKPITFIMPVLSPTEIGEYNEAMVFNQTLSRYESHMAIDFFAPEGTEVYAVCDGTIESVENTLLHGTTIVINHGNGVRSIYNSLADGDSVSIGQKVKQGDLIGEVSTSNRQEYKLGAHLHFSATENGEVIDPMKYLIINEK